jgi:uncharacterized protein
VPIGSERGDPTGPLYCDASALAKLLLPEAGSDDVNGLLAGRNDVLVSDLAVTEVVSALARHVRDGSLAGSLARRAHRQIVAILAAGSLRRVDLLASTHREAERLLLGARDTPLRAADALHLALALGAGTGTLLTYDRSLSRGARAHGLAVWPEDLG